MGYPQQPYGQQPSGPHQPPQGYGAPSGPYGYGRQPGPPPPPPRSSNLPVILLLVIGLPLLLLGGCMAVVVVIGDSGRDTVVSDADTRLAQPSRAAPVQPPEREEQPSQAAATVGQAITLEGRDPGLKVQVTLSRVIDPATAGEFFTPKTGNRLVAVELTLTNAGQATYSDSPTNGAVLIDSEGQQWRQSIADVREGQGFGGSVTMSGQDTRKGVIVYELPESAKPAKFQFALDSGFADQKGEWLLG